MRIGLAQINIIWENKEQNINKLRHCLESCNTVCDIVFFPEMSLTGFSMNTEYTAEADSQTVHICERLAREYGVAIGIGWVKQGGSKCENHYSIVTAEGREALDYTKLHPFSYSGEDRYFRGGDTLSACRIGDMKLGAVICYDLRFPEIFQTLSDKVDFIAVPACWPEKRRKHWLTLLEARAIENQCYIAGINCCGMINDTYYSGDSCLFGPDGQPVQTTDVIDLDVGCEGEKLFIYNIENNVTSVREIFPVKTDRRNELYGSLTVRGLSKHEIS